MCEAPHNLCDWNGLGLHGVSLVSLLEEGAGRFGPFNPAGGYLALHEGAFLPGLSEDDTAVVADFVDTALTGDRDGAVSGRRLQHWGFLNFYS